MLPLHKRYCEWGIIEWFIVTFLFSSVCCILSFGINTLIMGQSREGTVFVVWKCYLLLQYPPTGPSLQPCVWPPPPPSSPAPPSPAPLSSSSPQPSSSPLPPPPCSWGRSSWAGPVCPGSSASAAGSPAPRCCWSLRRTGDTLRTGFQYPEG